MQVSLRVVSPPVEEPVTVIDAAGHCRLDAEDPELPAYVAAARAWAETWLGRALITQTLAATFSHSPPPALGAGMVPYAGGYLSSGYPFLGARALWNRPIELPRNPVQSVASVRISRDDGTTADLAAADYLARLDGEPAVLQLRPISQAGPGDRVTITFVAGYGLKKATVPAPIRQGIMLLTAFLYENRGDAGGDPPKAAEMLMWPYRLVTFGG